MSLEWLQPTHPLFVFIMIWSLIWKGIALWHAAGHRQKGWFIVLLFIQTVGLLEIIYLLFFQRKK